MSNETTVILYNLASVLFYIVAITKFFNSGFSSGVIWLCLGSACLCFGVNAKSKKYRSEDEDTSSNK